VDHEQLDLDPQAAIDAFFLAVARAPDDCAVADGEQSFSWRELSRASSNVASWLSSLPTCSDDVVAIIAPRGVHAVVGITGVWMAGAAFAPFSLDPLARLANLLDNLRPKAVLVVAQIANLAAEYCFSHSIPLGVIEELSGHHGKDDCPIPRHVVPEDAAYIIFTSGSTGEPKAVTIEHRNINAVVESWRTAYKTRNSQMNVLQIGSFMSDVFIGDWLKVLSAPGKLVICPDGSKVDLRRLHEIAVDNNINFVESTPGLIIAFVRFLERNALDMPDLDIMVAGADYFRRAEYEYAVAVVRGRWRLINGYGLTECCIESSIYQGVGCDAAQSTSPYVPIGTPFPGVMYHILDDDCLPTSVGKIGELYISGAGVGRGYDQQPALTAQRFLTDVIPGERLYRTGDLVSLNRSGIYEYHGRKDLQIKLAGFRIEPGEIENTLLELPGIIQAAVVPTWEDGIVVNLQAFISGDTTTDDCVNIRSALARRLPGYMVPRSVRALPQLPINANGKIDRRALESLAAANGVIGWPTVAADHYAGDLEAKVGRAWSTTLQVHFVDPEASFFDLGGDSMLLLRLYARLAEEFGEVFSVAELYSHFSVRSFTNLLANREAPSSSEDLSALVDALVDGELDPQDVGQRLLASIRERS